MVSFLVLDVVAVAIVVAVVAVVALELLLLFLLLPLLLPLLLLLPLQLLLLLTQISDSICGFNMVHIVFHFINIELQRPYRSTTILLVAKNLL